MPLVKDISENSQPKTFWEKSRKYVFVGIIGLLGITLLLPTAIGRGFDPSAAVAMANGKKISQQEFVSYEGQWSTLMRLPMMVQGGQLAPAAYRLPGVAVQQIESHKELFMLLALEAKAQGIRTSTDEVNSFLKNEVQLPANLTVEGEQALKQSVASMFAIERMFMRASSGVKVSQPLLDLEIATRLKEVDLEFVEIPAGEFLASVGVPTAEQLQAQFKEFADTIAPIDLNTPSGEKNEMGFGYKLPNRIKTQYIGFGRDAIQNAVLASKNDYDWEVAARKYYIENPDEFKKAPGASSNPNAKLEDMIGTRPFEEVKSDILAKLRQQEQTSLATRVRSRLEQQLAADYVASEAKSSQSGEKAPNTRYGVPYRSPEYFSKLAAAIQQEMGVVLTVGSIQDSLQTATDLGRLAGIGTTVANTGVPFAQYATSNVRDFVPKDGPRPEGKVLGMFEPSGVMTDSLTGGQFFFRVTEAAVAAAPSELPNTAVESDWRILQAFEAAKKAGEALAKQASIDGLESAGKSAGRFVKQAGSVRLIQPTVAGLLSAPVSAGALQQGLTKATGEFQVGSKLPTVVALPRDRKVLVVNVKSAKTNTFGVPADMLANTIGRQIQSGTRSMIANSWFDAEQVRARTGFKPLDG